MIEAIIALINSRLEALDLFKDIKGLCEQIQKVEGENTLTYPAQYCEGEYQPIDDLRNWEEGLAYHRQIGENTEEIGEEAVNACDEEVTRAYPMRIVCLIPKNKLSEKNNDQYIDDKLSTNIANTLKVINNKTIAQTLKADVVSVDIISTQKDRYLVFEEEFTLPDGKVPGFEFAFFFIDYTITITATQSCFDNFDCDGFVTPQFCDPAIITDSDGVTIFEVGSGKTGACTPCSDPIICPKISELTCQELNDKDTGLVIPTQRNVIQMVDPLKTGQTISFDTEDDGDEERGRLVNITTLNCNNPFGNTNRFTNDKGGSVKDGSDGSTVDYILDWATRRAWDLDSTGIANDDYDSQLVIAKARVFAGFSDWKIPNFNELASIYNIGRMGIDDRQWNYAPFNILKVNVWTSSGDATQKIATDFMSFTRQNIGSNRGLFLCRTFAISELTIP